MDDYVEVNRANWDERAPVHATSPDYRFEEFRTDPSFLSEVVRFDLPRLGDVRDLDAVHLQCHIGTDTLSLSRLGARMTGLDFSAAALTEARRLAGETGATINYVHGEVYDAVELLGAERFDLVFTGIGAICWLPSIARWAETVAGLLKPGGRLFLREGHPMLWTLEDGREDDLIVVRFPYFEMPEPTVWDEQGTYVQTDAVFTHTTSHDWNHGLGETVTALLDAGLRLTQLVEHDTVPWNALPGQMEQVGELREWRLRDRPERVPHTYTLQAVKTG